LTRRRSFDELYPTQASYERYNPVGKGIKSSEFGYQTEAGKEKRIKQGMPGFSLLDYAYRDASYTANHTLEGRSSGMNREFYSWSPLGRARKPDGVPR